MHPKRLVPLAAGAALLAVVADVVTLAAGHHIFAFLIQTAVDPKAKSPSVLSTVSGALTSIQGDLEAFAFAGGPLALIGSGIAVAFGHRRGAGMGLAAILGLALVGLAPTIAQ